MKTRLHVLYGVLICGLLFFSQGAQAQINYSEDFESEENGWDDEDTDDFYFLDELSCDGEGVLTGSFYNDTMWGFGFSPVTVSPSLGASNGQEATLTFDYKILDWDDLAFPNNPNWGNIIFEYATSASGPWTEIQEITPSNHIVAASCTLKTMVFTPPTAANLYLRITAAVNEANDIDARFMIDNVSLVQDFSGACSDTPVAIAATSSLESVCIGGEVTLSFTPGYDLSGISYQWQSSDNGTDYEDVTDGGEEATYTTTQTATTWYRVIATCDAGGDDTTSTPIEVPSSGLPCYCLIEFETAEPITLVQFAGIDNETDTEVNNTPPNEDFTSLEPAEVTAGGTYEITVMGNTNGEYENYFAAYIDFNHNGDFSDEGERFELGYLFDSEGEDELTEDITIPGDAMTGLTRMRIVKHWYDPDLDYPAYLDEPCGAENNEYGQAEDYLINITEGAGCTVAPEMAVVESDETSVCTSEGLELSLSVNYSEDGITYQWQSSEDGEEFTDIEGANDDEYETEPTDMDMWYRAVITCENGDLSTTTEAIAIATTGMPCYCEMEFNNDVEPITLVQFAGIDNESDPVVDGSPAVEDFTSLTPGEVMLGGTYDIALMGNTGGDYQNYFTVYIDFNHNGDLSDEGEAFPIGTLIFSTGTDGDMLEGEITIPDDVMTGTTLMRVVKHYTYDNPTYPASLEDPCGEENTGYGQAEDYLLNITEPPLFDYYNLQWPAAMTYPNGTEDYNIYAQAYEPGVTEAAGLGEGVMGWIGFSTENTDPATWDESSWVAGTFNQTDNNNDEVMLTVDGSLPAGTYYYASRWQLADGPYTYGGFVGEWNGTTVVNGVLTVLCTTMEASIENQTQEFCNGATVADLQATATEEGGEIVWYLSMDAETPLSSDTLLADGTAYFAAQLANGCESVRNDVVVTINMITPPVVNNQIIEVETGAEATVEDLAYTGEGTINWYANLNDIGENSIEAGTMITAGTYYATLTVDGCESDYVTFTVDVLLGANGFTKGTFIYYPNPVKDMLKLSYSEGITGVEVFNLVGQRVISMAKGQNEANVDMSALASGTYVVKVSSGDATAMIKVVKE